MARRTAEGMAGLTTGPDACLLLLHIALTAQQILERREGYSRRRAS